MGSVWEEYYFISAIVLDLIGRSCQMTGKKTQKMTQKKHQQKNGAQSQKSQGSSQRSTDSMHMTIVKLVIATKVDLKAPVEGIIDISIEESDNITEYSIHIHTY